jgi:protein involved in polysaccharide export with SLBB domain
VNSPGAITYNEGQNMDYYVAAAGGYTRRADKSRSYVTQPNGKVESVKGRFLLSDGKPKPLAGAAVFVPDRDPSERKDWLQTAAALAQIIAGLATTVLVVNNIR